MDLNLVKIRKKYHNNIIIDNFTYTFKSNHVYFILGESGCGKSTLLKIIANIIDDYEGEILINNKNIKSIDQQYVSNHLITYINQDAELLNYLTINENCDFLINKKLDKKYKQKFRLYSGGEKKRISAYVNSLKNTEIILADEISSSLDKNNALIIMNYLREIAKNKILIVVTHDKFLINEDDEVIDFNNLKSKNIKSNNKFKYKKIAKKKNNIIKYAFYKIKDKVNYIINFVSSFMVGLTLILLVSSLKDGILSFLDKELLKNFDLEYLFIENNDAYFKYGFENEYKNISNDGILLLHDVSFDPIKNSIYINVDNVPIYIKIDNNYSISKQIYDENDKDYSLNINGYICLINNINDYSERIITVKKEFFYNYYYFKGYNINQLNSKKAILKVNKAFIMTNYEKIIKSYSNIKIRNSGIEAYFYMNNILDKINTVLIIFTVISLIVTLSLISTLINLELIDDKKEITFMNNIGFAKKRIFNFYYLINIYRGIITFIFTIMFYIVMITISNAFLRSQLGLRYNILNINKEYIIIIFILIISIISISLIISKKRIINDKN